MEGHAEADRELRLALRLLDLATRRSRAIHEPRPNDGSSLHSSKLPLWIDPRQAGQKQLRPAARVGLPDGSRLGDARWLRAVLSAFRTNRQRRPAQLEFTVA